MHRQNRFPTGLDHDGKPGYSQGVDHDGKPSYSLGVDHDGRPGDTSKLLYSTDSHFPMS
jgi:hypothetical protein